MTDTIGGPSGKVPTTTPAGTAWDKKGAFRNTKMPAMEAPPCIALNAGNGGPTMYRHKEGANFGFYDGHAERLAKEEAWIQSDWDSKPKQPGRWVAVPQVWNKYR